MDLVESCTELPAGFIGEFVTDYCVWDPSAEQTAVKAFTGIDVGLSTTDLSGSPQSLEDLKSSTQLWFALFVCEPLMTFTYTVVALSSKNDVCTVGANIDSKHDRMDAELVYLNTSQLAAAIARPSEFVERRRFSMAFLLLTGVLIPLIDTLIQLHAHYYCYYPPSTATAAAKTTANLSGAPVVKHVSRNMKPSA
eukprot:Lankesteria_metandrocarpae@DN10729_c0_g1_i1.p1